MLARLRTIRAEGGYEWWVQRTRWLMLLLAVAFLAVLAIPLANPSLPARVRFTLHGLDVLIWAAFVATTSCGSTWHPSDGPSSAKPPTWVGEDHGAHGS